ncbi:hypothetical protein ACFL26_00510 [Patescibacteria group bacterium]
MFGFLIAFVIFCVKALVYGATTGAAVIAAGWFLIVWYSLVALTAGVVMLFVTFGTTAILGLFGGVLGSMLGVGGAVAGTAGGAAAGGLLLLRGWVYWLLRNGLRIGGVYAIITAGTAAMELSQFDPVRAGIGIAMIIVGSLFFRLRSGSKVTISRGD